MKAQNGYFMVKNQYRKVEKIKKQEQKFFENFNYVLMVRVNFLIAETLQLDIS